MSNITELTAKLKAAAVNATAGEWCADDYHGVVADAGLNGNYYIASCSGPDHRSNKRFIALASPANVLALTEALEAAQSRIASLEARTLTVKLKQYDEFWIEHIAPGCPDGYAKGFIDGRNYGEKQIKTACAAAGIKLQIEGE